MDRVSAELNGRVTGPAGARRRIRPVVIGMTLGAVVVACAWGARPARLTGAAPTPDALAAQVLEGFASRDVQGLRQLAVSEEEFRATVWPKLPAARPERNLPLQYVWGELHQKSDASLRMLLARHGGRRLRLLGIRYEGTVTDYGTYSVHRRTVLDVEDPTGLRHSIRLFGSTLHDGAGYKVFSYVVD